MAQLPAILNELLAQPEATKQPLPRRLWPWFARASEGPNGYGLRLALFVRAQVPIPQEALDSPALAIHDYVLWLHVTMLHVREHAQAWARLASQHLPTEHQESVLWAIAARTPSRRQKARASRVNCPLTFLLDGEIISGLQIWGPGAWATW